MGKKGEYAEKKKGWGTSCPSHKKGKCKKKKVSLLKPDEEVSLH